MTDETTNPEQDDDGNDGDDTLQDELEVLEPDEAPKDEVDLPDIGHSVYE